MDHEITAEQFIFAQFIYLRDMNKGLECQCHMTYLVNIITRNGVVKCIVEIVQQFNDLYWTTFRRQDGESHDIGEVDCGARIHLRSHTTSSFQFVGHVTIKPHTHCLNKK